MGSTSKDGSETKPKSSQSSKSTGQGKTSLPQQPDVFSELHDPAQDEFWYEKVNSDPWKLSLTEKTFYFHNLDSRWNPTGVSDARVFTYIKNTHHMFVQGRVVYIYKDGYYHEDEEEAMLKTIIRGCLLEQYIKSTTIDRIHRLFLQDVDLIRASDEINTYSSHWVNFENGMYNAIEGKMYKHSWKTYSTVQVPWPYEPGKDYGKGKELEEFLHYAIPDADDREMLLQYIGYCCTKDTRQQKMLIMCGDGGTGKSTVINLIQAIVGKRNTSNVPMSKLSERFTAVFMQGKLLNSCADLEIDALDDVSIIKQLIGEDEIKAEHKGKAVFSFENFAKMLFSTNELPLVRNEKTDGFYRRLLVLTMNVKPKVRDVNLKDKLKREIPYLIHISMQALQRMYKAGGIHVSENSIKPTRQLRKDSDTIEAFLTDNCVHGTLDDKLDRKELYEKYAEYCKEWGRESHKKNAFFKALRSKGFSDKPSNGIYFFRGIRWKGTDSDGFVQITDDMDIGDLPFDL